MSTRLLAIATITAGLLVPAVASAQSQQPATSVAATGAPTPSVTNAPDPDRLAKVRADADARRNGRRARVRLVDGSVAYGRIIGTTDQSLALQPSPADEPVMYEFTRVRSIEGPGMPRWVWIAVGAGAAGLVALAAAN